MSDFDDGRTERTSFRAALIEQYRTARRLEQDAQMDEELRAADRARRCAIATASRVLGVGEYADVHVATGAVRLCRPNEVEVIVGFAEDTDDDEVVKLLWKGDPDSNEYGYEGADGGLLFGGWQVGDLHQLIDLVGRQAS